MDRVVRRHRTIPCEQGDPEVARSTYIKAEAELAGAGRVSFDPTGDTFRAGQRVKLAEAQQPAGQAAYSNILDLAVATSVMTRVRGAFGSRPLPSTSTWSQTGHSITSCSAPDARGGPQQQDRGQGQRPGSRAGGGPVGGRVLGDALPKGPVLPADLDQAHEHVPRRSTPR